MASAKVTTVLISKSSKQDKKYQATINNKTVHFGAKGYEDYTTHKNPERKNRQFYQKPLEFRYLFIIIMFLGMKRRITFFHNKYYPGIP